MEHKQTFIAYIYDNNGRQMDFVRFACKKASTVKNNMMKLKENSLYRVCTKGADHVKVFATPNGIDKESIPCMEFEFVIPG